MVDARKNFCFLRDRAQRIVPPIKNAADGNNASGSQ